MADFKSSFMGGYKKKDVDEYIEKLEKENEKLKEDAKSSHQKVSKAAKLQDEYKKLKAKVSELENQKINDENEKALLAGEINNLNEQIGILNSQLAKSTKANDNHIANIGKIFYSAYESGSEIVDEAKDGTKNFLSEIAKSSIEAKAEIENAITSYALINTDIKALAESIVKNINAVSANTDKLIEKAKSVADSMGKIDDIRLKNEENANGVIKKYDSFFKEYESEKTSEAVEILPANDNEVSPAVSKVEPLVKPVENESKTQTASQEAVFKASQKEVAPPAVQPIIENEINDFEEPAVPPIQTVAIPQQNVRAQRQAANANRQPIQRRPVQVQKQAVNQNRQSQNSQMQKQSQPNQMNQNRAVMLREVLKKFQNNEEQN